MEISRERTEALLSALEEQLAARGERFELVVIGGFALIALELVPRTATKDVDVVARDFEVDEGWLNAGPADLLRWGLPDGFVDRLTPRRYGDHLVVHFAGRLDQIHFKLYAATDQQGGRHESDLLALEPTRDELESAARWTTTQDPSEGFLLVLRAKLADLGVADADLGA